MEALRPEKATEAKGTIGEIENDIGFVILTTDETQTRKEIIDKKLKQCDWNVIHHTSDISILSTLVAIEEYPTESGPADYVFFVNRNPLAIVEAKKVSTNPYSWLTEAQRYARSFISSPFDFGEYRVPFIYSTNGIEIWFQDLRKPESGAKKVFHFHTPEALQDFLSSDDSTARKNLLTPIEGVMQGKSLRYYQLDAIKPVENALLKNKRKMLVAMATGTRKTILAATLIYRLIKSGMFKRILFLVDRRQLAKQTEDKFANFEPEIGRKFDKIYSIVIVRMKENEIPENADVYICTIQRMYSILKGKELPEDIDWDDPWEWDKEDTPVE